ncbi:ABC transporter ATP-binding protein [Rhizobacter sp. AJA081-3]|uniref:ABC transporter ATP-binding protein n=1 Tax=Rhizobacter sp. AJA081-3 TaxID=2753607 RepID=UPI001ADF06A5|nr:ABC transporter ATP-binding protein [Rhizobacter sp. AJA081-3]QTN22172.1 ABC transporter ATP-binding protein [Rhizobacter sp. AJA081-3]
MLELKDVHTHYGLSHVLQGVSLRVDAGEVVGLFGRNGVGKTTVMKTIAGWVAPSQGSVFFDGQAIGGVASERICRQGIGFVPEDRRIFPGLTVEENLVLGFMQSPGRSRAEDRRQLDATYTRFPRLGERRQQMGTTLSGGEQQMLAMARVLVGRPRLLLIDEPTEGLAPKIVDEIFTLMEGLRRDGIPILLVEQNMHRAIGLVQRFYVLERGAVVIAGDGAKAADREALMRQLAV